MTRPRRRTDWLAWCLAGLLALSLASVLHVASQVGSPYGGYLEEDGTRFDEYRRVSAYTPPWWPNLARYQLRGQVLLSLDGQPYRPAAARLFAAAAARGETAVTLVTRTSAGDTLTTRLPLRIFTWSDYLDVRLPAAITGLSCWLLAALLYETRPHEPLNRVAAWSFGLVSALAGAGWFSIFVGPFMERVINAVLNGWLWSFSGAAILHLALKFPRPSRLLTRSVLSGLYGLAGAAALIHNVSVVLGAWTGWTPLVGRLDSLGSFLGQNILFLLGLAGLVLRLAAVWFTSNRQPLVRRQAGVVLIGFVIASPFLILLAGQLSGWPVSLFLENLDTRYLLLAVPLMFTLSILRYKSFQTSHPLLVGVAVLASSALAASLGAWVVERSQGQAALPLSQAFLPIFLVTLAVGVFWSAQTSWQGWLTRLFHWERRSYAAARVFGQRLVGASDLATLPDRMARELVATLGVEQAAVWRWNSAAGRLELAGQAGRWAAPLPASLLPETLDEPVRLGPNAPEPPAWLQPLRAAGAETAAPLLSPAGRIGLLALGKQWDEEVFDERDLEIVALAALQASLLLLTAQQIDELRQVPASLTEAQKRERRRIAQDLHDTVQQRLGALQFMLETANLRQAADPGGAAELIERSMDEVETVAQMVSRIRLELMPPELAQGLATALERLVERYHHRAGLEIRLQLPAGLDQRLTAEARTELYLVLLQALDNVVEHARAQRVAIELAVEGERLTFAVADDGQGGSPDGLRLAQAKGSFGLLSMEARLAGLRGALVLELTPGAGARLTGWLPLASGPNDPEQADPPLNA